jgi:thioredoxin reductase (NADPH)
MTEVYSRHEQMFPVLNPNQVATALRFACDQPHRFAPGQVLYAVGSHGVAVWLILEGSIDVVRRDGLGREAAIISGGPGEFTGEVGLLGDRASLAEGRAGPQGCLAVPFDVAHLRSLIIGSAELGEIIMRAFILRRVGMLGTDRVGSVLIGRLGEQQLVRLQGFLTRNGYPHTVLDIATHGEEARLLIERFGVAQDDLPLMICPNGNLLKQPSNAEAGICLGITPQLDALPWSAPVLPGWRRRCTPLPRDCRYWCWTSAPLAARPGPRRGSRTTWAFPPESPGRPWPGGRSIRRRNSARKWPFP